MKKLFLGVLLTAGLLPLCAAYSDQHLDGIWLGTEKLSLAKRSDCPVPDHQTLPAKIAVAQSGSLLAVVDGYGQGRYTSIHWWVTRWCLKLQTRGKESCGFHPTGKH